MPDDEAALTLLRTEISRAHELVTKGGYDAAITAFATMLPRLEAALGADHPEVAELRDDLAAAKEMRDVYGFGRMMGFRHWTDPVPGENG